MKLYNHQSGKTTLQAGLDREQANATAVAEMPCEGCCTCKNKDKPLFKKPKDETKVFQVDLLGGWVKP